MALYRVIALGDSLTYGYPFGKALSWVEQSSQELGVQILNQGINGDNLSHMLKRLTRDVLDLKPEICIVMGGTNDVYQGVDLENLKVDYEKITEKILEEKILPLVALPPPIKDSALEKKMAKYRTWLKKHAKSYSLKILDFYSPFMDKKKKRTLPGTLEDGFHPSSKGYRAMTEMAVKTLKPLLEN